MAFVAETPSFHGEEGRASRLSRRCHTLAFQEIVSQRLVCIDAGQLIREPGPTYRSSKPVSIQCQSEILDMWGHTKLLPVSSQRNENLNLFLISVFLSVIIELGPLPAQAQPSHSWKSFVCVTALNNEKSWMRSLFWLFLCFPTSLNKARIKNSVCEDSNSTRWDRYEGFVVW